MLLTKLPEQAFSHSVRYRCCSDSHTCCRDRYTEVDQWASGLECLDSNLEVLGMRGFIMEGVKGVPFTLGAFGLAPAYTITGVFIGVWSGSVTGKSFVISDCILTDFGVANLLEVGLAGVYVVHQQDHLLLSQLRLTFPPVWME